MNRNVLIGLAALAVALIGGVVGWRVLAPNAVGGGGVARIAIVTDKMLGDFADAQDAQQYANDARAMAIVFASQHNNANAQRPAAAAATPSEPPPAAAAATPAANTNDALLLKNLLSDQMEAQLSHILSDSHRFAVSDPSSLTSIIQRMSRERAGGGAQQQPQQQSTPAEAVTHAAQNGIQNVTANSSTSDGHSRLDSLIAQNPSENGDLASAAAALQVDYLLAVSLQEPQYTSEVVVSETSHELVFRIEADPVFVYRLYNVGQRRTVFSEVARLDGPVAVEVPFRTLLVAGTDLVSEQNLVTNIARASQEMGQLVQRRIAQQIVNDILDRQFPAQIAQLDPLTITRGSNDGYEVGQKVQVVHLDTEHAVSERGAVLDVPESRVGLAEVISVQNNIATIRLDTGVTLDPAKREQYVVRRLKDDDAGGGGGQAATSSGGGLGMDAARAGDQSNAQIYRIAVGDLNQSGATPPAGVRLENAMTTRFAQDQRIRVVSRANLDQIRREQNMGSGGSRRSYSPGDIRVARAGYLILGEVTVQPRRNQQTVNVAGAAPRVVSTSWALVANGTLHIESLNSEVQGPYTVSASVPISGANGATDPEAWRALSVSFANAAYSAVAVKLFPIQVANVSGSTVILTRGADAGLRVGDRLNIFALGDPITDPTTNAVISPGARTRVGGVRITDVQDTIATATLDAGSAATRGNVAEVVRASAPARASSTATTTATTERVPW